MNQPTLWNYALGDLADANELKDTAPEQGRVSLRNLFQEINAIPIANGGIAPKRKDINCLFKAIGEHIFYIQRGGQYSWQADVTYPKNAVITYNDVEYKASEENTGMVPDLNQNVWKPLVEVTQEKLQKALDALPKYTSATTEKEGLVQLSNDLDSDSETTAATSLAVKTLDTKIGTANTNINSLSDLVSTTSQNVSKVTADVSSLSSDIQSLSTRTRNLENNVSGITSNAENIAEMQTQVSNLQRAQNTLSATVDTHSTDIRTIKSDINTLNLAVGDTTAINGIETRVNKLESTVNEFSDITGVFKYDQADEYLVGTIVDYNSKLYRATIPEGGETDKVPAGTIPGADGSENYWTLIDSEVRSSLTNLGSEISDLQNSVNSTASKATEAESKVNTLTTTVGSISDSVEDVRNDVDKLKGIYQYESGVEYDADEIIEFNNVLYKSLAKTSLGPVDAPDNWKALSGEVDLTEVNAKLKSLETSDTNITKRLDTVESTVNTLSSIGGDVNNLASKTELNAISDRVQTLEGIDHSQYALKSEIPESVDTSTLATKEELNSYALKTEIPEPTDTSTLATKEELKGYALKTEIPDTTGFATQDSVKTLEQKVKSLEDNATGLEAWSAEKTYKVGNVVIYNDKIYQATATSLNSAPADSNSNWKEISESEASTLLTKINAVSDRVQTLEGIDHSRYALKTDIPEPTDTSTLATKEELKSYALKTEIPTVDTSTLATKAEVKAIDTRVQTLEAGSSTGTVAAYKHYLVSGMLDGTSDIDTEDIGQNDWNVAYTANGPAFKSINISSDHRIITVDFDGKYDVRAFRVDVYKTFLANDGQRLVRFTIDGKTDGWNTARYYPMGYCAKAGCYNVAGTGDTNLMEQVSGTNPYELLWRPTSIGEGLSFYIKM